MSLLLVFVWTLTSPMARFLADGTLGTLLEVFNVDFLAALRPLRLLTGWFCTLFLEFEALFLSFLFELRSFSWFEETSRFSLLLDLLMCCFVVLVFQKMAEISSSVSSNSGS